MKNGTCPKCNSTNVYFQDYELVQVLVNGKKVEYRGYVCTDCGYCETYITDKDTLDKIPVRAEKIGDWKKAK
jgi:predicted nucleic-acid-binding Zn-ribbon protein